MSVPTSHKTKFWIVCCEATEATQAIASAVDGWQLPGVRSLLIDQSRMAAIDQLAQANYAIFITPYTQPCSRMKVSPLGTARPALAAPATFQTFQSPAALLSEAHSRHGQSPQSWWFQLPITEVRARCIQPIPIGKSVAQALNKIEVFVRNYRLAITPNPTHHPLPEHHSQPRQQQLATVQLS
ncbi:hypothetical protein BH23CYA1_BH23CYA1_14200 [soil metagenome]